MTERIAEITLSLAQRAQLAAHRGKRDLMNAGHETALYPQLDHSRTSPLSGSFPHNSSVREFRYELFNPL